MPYKTPRLTVLATILFAASAAAFAQSTQNTAATATPQAAADDDIVHMSEFEVSAKSTNGYMASETATGTRYAARILDQPMSIQTITSEFIENFIALDLNDVVAYSPGFTPAEGTGAFTLRGIRTTQSQYKNGIREGGIYAPADVDRVEIIRGPNAAIYGATVPSGLRNVVTKSPKSKAEYEIKAMTGSDDFYRVVLSANQPIIANKLLTRFDFSSEESKQYTQNFAQFRRRSFYNATTWKIGPNTTLNTHFEYIKFRSQAQNTGTMPWVWNDVALPNATGGTTTVKNVYTGMFGTGTWDKYDYLNTGGPMGYNQVEYTQIDGNLTHRFSKWMSLRVLGSHWQRNQNIVRTANSNGGTYNVFNATTGVLLGTSNPRLEKNRDFQDAVQADLLFDFATGPVKHKLLLTGDYSESDTHALQRTSTNSSALLPLNTYFWGNQMFYNPNFDYSFNFSNTTLWNKLGTDQDRQTTSKGLMISERASVWKDRIIGFIGARHDQSASSQLDYLNGTKYNNVSYTAGQVVDYAITTANTIQSGIVGKVTSNISLYANYSQSYNPQRTDVATNRDYYGAPLPANRGNGWETGVKMSLLEEHLNFTLGYYDISMSNVARVARNPDGSAKNNINGDQYSLLNNIGSKGVEFDYNWRVNNNVNLFGNVSWNDIHYTSVANTSEAYLLGVRPDSTPEWSGAIAMEYKFTTGVLKGLSTRIGIRYVGDMLVNNTTYSVYGNSNVRAPDLTVGTGASAKVYPQYFFQNSSYTVVDAGVGYSWQNWKLRQRVGLDVKNLLNEKYMKIQRPGDPFALFVSYDVKY